jgi:hypothetical protein
LAADGANGALDEQAEILPKQTVGCDTTLKQLAD